MYILFCVLKICVFFKKDKGQANICTLINDVSLIQHKEINKLIHDIRKQINFGFH